MVQGQDVGAVVGRAVAVLKAERVDSIGPVSPTVDQLVATLIPEENFPIPQNPCLIRASKPNGEDL